MKSFQAHSNNIDAITLKALHFTLVEKTSLVSKQRICGTRWPSYRVDENMVGAKYWSILEEKVSEDSYDFRIATVAHKASYNGIAEINMF